MSNKNELNPNHPVTRAMHESWHKVVAMMLAKMGVTTYTISPNEVSELGALIDGTAITARVTDEKGIELSLVSIEEAMRLAKEGK